MIKVQIGRENGVFRAISTGHADYQSGNDPICGAVSALMYMLAGSVKNLTSSGKQRNKIQSGSFDVRYSPGSNEDEAVAAVIFNTAIIGLAQVEAAHPDHLQINKKLAESLTQF